MRFTETRLAGAFLIELEPKADDRGYNARAWCRREFEDAGLNADLAQVNVIANHRRGTLRGMHFQHPPYAETKLFRVTRGALHDVVVDLRPESPTFMEWESFGLRAGDGRMLYVPERFGQGFLTLEDNTELTYQVTEFYTPGHEGGFRYDDPAVAIAWPGEPEVISEKDRDWAPLGPDWSGLAVEEGVTS